MSTVAPETEARQHIKTILETEFAGDGFLVQDDRLDESLGLQGGRIGTSPVVSRPWTRNENVLAMEILVQFYGKWRNKVDPNMKVDPAIIEAYAERFRSAIRGNDPKTSGVWYFQVSQVNYVNDPTGNKTRFEATVMAIGTNTALLETS